MHTEFYLHWVKTLGYITFLSLCISPFSGHAQSSPDILICTIVEGDSLGILRINLEDQSSSRIINNPAINGWPSMIPNGQLLFDSKRTGNWELYLLNTEGATTRLTTSANSWYPQFNKVSGVIAYNSIYANNVNIALTNLEGEFLKYLTTDSSFNGYPSWNPQGTELVFVSDRNGNRQLFRYTLSENKIDQLTFSSADINYPRWSPDGHKIAFISTEEENSDIYVLDLTNRSTKQITNNSLNEVHLYWSTCSVEIYFVVDDPGNYGIFQVDVESGNEQKLFSSDSLLLSPSIID